MLLDGQPGVLESAVVGVPDADFGEAAVGFLVASNEVDLDLDEIGIAVKNALARFKHPRKLVVIPELPRNAMGKIQKNLLREEYDALISEG